MGNTHWGLEIHLILIFICIFLGAIAHKCVGGGNLTTPSCSEQERLALLMFKHSLKDGHGMLSSWGVGDNCCRWERVGCDDVTGRVVSLHLRKNVRENYYVNGDIKVFVEDYGSVGVNEDYLVADEVNSCLKELVSLQYLDLSGNHFQRSQIPEFIGSLIQLRYLNLSDAGFSGNIPHQIGNLSSLEVLDLHSSPNYLKELTPELMTHDMAWISGLPKLEHLDMSGVDLSRAQNINGLLYTIPSLLKLSLSRCGLSMAHLGSHQHNSSRELSNIRHLDLSGNNFRGQLPNLFLNVTSLAFLDLSYSHLSITWRLGNLLNMIPTVSRLRLSGCNLQKIHLYPTNISFSTHSNIQYLDLSWNEIEGRFPSVLINMSSLKSLDLSVNKLNSSIPVMPNLLKLDISGNNIRQIEDVGLWRQCHLEELIGSYNKLEGQMIGPSTNVSKCSQHALEVLYLDSNTLNCSIPKSFGRLTNLRVLDLSSNELTGPIPEALENLRSLQGLYLSYNQLSSSIPESLGRLTTLTDLFLKSNRFTGPIPVSLGRLISLRSFSVSSNMLSGTIPNSIRQLTKLYYLDVSNNSLQGMASEHHFSNLSMLKYLNADFNTQLVFNISFEWIPPFQVKVVRLCSCKIEGGFPQWLRTQRKLEELALSNASIFGPLPTWLCLLPVINLLDLSHNKLTGSLTNLLSVYKVKYEAGGILLLQNNLFRGIIPRRLCTRTDLQVLDLSRNRLTGKIPRCLWNLSLSVMLLSSNRLSGVMPNSLGHTSLEWLQLNDNNINGELPRDFRYFNGLYTLDLGDNNISGNIPEWIGENITRLTNLRLHNNNFSGKVPHSLCKSQQLKILDLAHNNLNGSIPHCFDKLHSMKEILTYDSLMICPGYGNMMQVLKGIELDYTKSLKFVKNMDLSNNRLTGDIPEVLTTLDGLVGLNLSYNHFSGGIPKSIRNMKSLFSLDLSANKLTGIIPPSMAALNFLSHLNLSHNNFSGKIPTGNQLQTLTDPSIYADNTYLCGVPLSKECSPHESPPSPTSKNKYENANEPKKVWFYLDVMSGFATGFWGFIGVLLLKKQWRHTLFIYSEVTMDKIYVAVVVGVLKIKRGCIESK